MKKSPVFLWTVKFRSNNAFWEKKLIYIARGNGFRSIPVYYDLLFRMGVPKDELLKEEHVVFMERVMHYAMAVERHRISFEEQLAEINKMLEGKTRTPGFLKELMTYLEQPVLNPIGRLGMPVPALNRADVFLFVLCHLFMTEEQIQKAIEIWYALHTSYLLMDDIYDYKIDNQNGEENSILELGDEATGFSRAIEILNNNKKVLEPVNPQLSGYFEETFEEIKELIP